MIEWIVGVGKPTRKKLVLVICWPHTARKKSEKLVLVISWSAPYQYNINGGINGGKNGISEKRIWQPQTCVGAWEVP